MEVLVETSNVEVTVDDPTMGRTITLLLEMYKENTNHGRHLESQRQLVAGFILTIAAATLGALSNLKFRRDACVGLGLVLIVFGVMGSLFSIVQYGKYNQSRIRWRGARERLAELCPLADLERIYEKSKPGAIQGSTPKEKATAKWLKAGTWPLHWLWTLLMLIVLFLGLTLSFNADKLSSWAGSCS
jgi:Na+/melibiose symporter-like transporter